MCLARFILCLVFLAAPTLSRAHDECPNRVRDYFAFPAQFSAAKASLTKAQSEFERAEAHFQIAAAAWSAGPLIHYDSIYLHLDQALSANPLHAKAKELALLLAIRGVERGDAYALDEAEMHVQELIRYPEVVRDSAKLARVEEFHRWIESKRNGRNALEEIVHLSHSTEKNPRRFLEISQQLGTQFQQAIWEVGDSQPTVLEELLEQPVQEVLQSGVEVLGRRLNALLTLQRVDEAVREYREMTKLLSAEYRVDQDSTFLVRPILKMASWFGHFRRDPALQEWAAGKKRTRDEGSGSVDWIDYLILGHLEYEREDAEAYWRTAQLHLGTFPGLPISEPVHVYILKQFADLFN